MKLPKSKRLRIAITVIVTNYITFWIGMVMETDLVSLATGLAIINTPLLAYILGESFRPSVKK